MPAPLPERIRQRSFQLGLNTNQLAEKAGVNRSFLYDILSERSLNPSAEKLSKVARILKVDVDWLLTGYGENEAPLRDQRFVAIHSVKVTAGMGAARVVEDEVEEGEPYHFLLSWIRDDLRTSPDMLRIMRVEGDSMEPTLKDKDMVLVDMSRAAPTPPGIFVLFDGVGLVAKRLEHIPNSEPERVRIASDNPHYSAYERTVDEIRIVGRIRWFAREM